MTFVKQFLIFFFLFLSYIFGFGQLATSVEGVILNKRNNEPVAYAHVGIADTSIGSTTNMDGKFILYIPTEYANDTLFISHLNFKTFYFKPSNTKIDSQAILLEEQSIDLKEVVILAKGISPFELLKEAVDSTNLKSYSPVILHTYLREFSRKNTQFNYFADALIDYYLPFSKKKSSIEVRVVESRVRKVKVKLDEGFDHNFSHPFDIKDLIKYYNAETILKLIKEDHCDFKLTEVTNRDNETLFRIQFAPKSGQRKYFYEGIITIDKETMIIRSFERHVSDLYKEFTTEASLFLKHLKLSSSNIDIQYSILFKKCYLNRVRFDMKIAITNVKKIKVDYQSISEMTATGISANNIKSFDRKERFDFNQLYYMAGNNNGNNFKTSFWKNQNGLLATKDEEEAIESLSKLQLKRNK